MRKFSTAFDYEEHPGGIVIIVREEFGDGLHPRCRANERGEEIRIDAIRIDPLA